MGYCQMLWSPAVCLKMAVSWDVPSLEPLDKPLGLLDSQLMDSLVNSSKDES